MLMDVTFKKRNCLLNLKMRSLLVYKVQEKCNEQLSFASLRLKKEVVNLIGSSRDLSLIREKLLNFKQ